jgi:hypothetical protein
MAAMLADGGAVISDLAVLGNQPELFDPLPWIRPRGQVLAALDDEALSRLRNARARAREVAGGPGRRDRPLPSSTVAGFMIPGLILDLDATLVQVAILLSLWAIASATESGYAPTMDGSCRQACCCGRSLDTRSGTTCRSR